MMSQDFVAPFSILFILSAAGSTWVAYLISLVIYRLYFHPLAKFPGPRYAAISRWHEFYYEVIKQGRFTWKIQEYHEKYGPIVRVVPDELHILDSSFYDTLYTKAGRTDKYEWGAGRFNAPWSHFSTSSAELHAVRRAALNPLFSRARILDFEGVVRNKVKQLIGRIKEFRDAGKPLLLSGCFNALAGDVIMQYCFSFNYNHLDSPDFVHTFHEAFMAASRSGHLSVQFPVVPKILFSLPESWLERIEPLFNTLFRMQRDIGQQIVALKEGHSTYQKAIPPTVIHELLANPNLSDAEKETWRLQDEAQIVLGAGVTTASWSLAVGSFHITSNPDIYAKLRKELEEAIPDPYADLKWTNLEKLPYLTGCIREAVRLAYPVASRNVRLNAKPLQYKEWIIPERTPVSMTIEDISNDEEIFPQHSKFLPERWLNNPRTKDGSSLDRYFVVFQRGSRSCLGINLAYAELYHTMAAVFRNFKFELYETDESDVKLAHDFFVPSPKLDSKGVRVKVLPNS